MVWCGLFVDYCDVFIRYLDSHSVGTHSLLANVHLFELSLKMHVIKQYSEVCIKIAWIGSSSIDKVMLWRWQWRNTGRAVLWCVIDSVIMCSVKISVFVLRWKQAVCGCINTVKVTQKQNKLKSVSLKTLCEFKEIFLSVESDALEIFSPSYVNLLPSDQAVKWFMQSGNIQMYLSRYQ